jgi:hypothetical protein
MPAPRRCPPQADFVAGLLSDLLDELDELDEFGELEEELELDSDEDEDELEVVSLFSPRSALAPDCFDDERLSVL